MAKEAIELNQKSAQEIKKRDELVRQKSRELASLRLQLSEKVEELEKAQSEKNSQSEAFLSELRQRDCRLDHSSILN